MSASRRSCGCEPVFERVAVSKLSYSYLMHICGSLAQSESSSVSIQPLSNFDVRAAVWTRDLSQHVAT